MPGAAVQVSVVIPTLGGECLRETIARLNAGSLSPAEILICIPREEAYRAAAHTHPNVRVFVTRSRGQVAQRAEGFRQAAHELVLQIDDDILVHERCLERLAETLEGHGQRCAVAPELRWISSQRSVYSKISDPVVARIFYWILNGRTGYRPGTVTKAGAEIGVSRDGAQPLLVESEWLAGGCVLHRRSNLVVEDYFPFAGKAFCEDLIHSHLLKSRQIRLIVDQRALADVAEPPRVSMGAFLRGLRSDLRARRHYVELSARSKPRMYCYYLVKILRRVVQR